MAMSMAAAKKKQKKTKKPVIGKPLSLAPPVCLSACLPACLSASVSEGLKKWQKVAPNEPLDGYEHGSSYKTVIGKPLSLAPPVCLSACLPACLSASVSEGLKKWQKVAPNEPLDGYEHGSSYKTVIGKPLSLAPPVCLSACLSLSVSVSEGLKKVAESGAKRAP